VKGLKVSPLALRLGGWLILLTTLPMLGLVLFSRTNLEVTLAEAAATPRFDLVRLLASELTVHPADPLRPWRIIESVNHGGTVFFLVNRAGVILFHPDGDRVGTNLRDFFPKPVVEAVLAGGDGSFVAREWRQFPLSYAQVPQKDTIVVAWADGAAMEQRASSFVDRLNTQIALLALLISLGGGLVLWVAVGTPVWKLSKAAEKMGEGDLSVEVDPEAMIDDLRTLALSFNRMSARIRDLVGNLTELNSSLEDRVQLRTGELQAANEDLAAVLKHLQSTQDQLMRTERFSALGQLSANILHELNTPLGAISSAARSQRTYLVREFRQALDYLSTLPEPVRETFVGLAFFPAETGLQPNRKTVRAARDQLVPILERMGVANSAQVAEAAASLGFLSTDPRFSTLVGRPDFLTFLEHAEALAAVTTLGRVIDLSSGKAGQVIAKLKGFLVNYGHDDPIPIDIDLHLEEALQQLLDSSRTGVTVVRRPSGARLSGSRLNLHEVWIGLFKNALQAMNYQGTLEIETLQQEAGVSVRITDSGPGIPPEIQDRIFEPFFTTKTTGEGLGLGLDIARSMVERAGGTITFESRPGRTCFQVDLPKHLS